MCGFCGAVWTTAEGFVSQETIQQMTDVLTHRGPDQSGTLRLALNTQNPFSNSPSSKFYSLLDDFQSETSNEKGIVFGHRRLSILDLTEDGRQPLCNEDGTVWVVFNGEIYNYLELESILKLEGHQFRTKTDTEVIVHLYEKYGTDFLHEINGMFAIALWDVRKKQLILARDRMGKKPLFYRQESNRLIFASEIKSLMKVPGIRQVIDPIALDQYFIYQYIPFPRTIYQGISKLPPGHFAVWSEGTELKIEPFWLRNAQESEQERLENERISSLRTFGDWQSELSTRLEKAVQIRLRSDVPLGAFLSGGIDSSIIVGLMQKFSSQKVKTFSIGFAQKEYDETPLARRTAQRLGTEHEEFFVSPEVENILPEIIDQYDEPFADSSAIPTWFLSQMTKKRVTVALSGDGSDELFAGYNRYQAVRLGCWGDHIPKSILRILIKMLQWTIPNTIGARSPFRRTKRFLEALDMPPLERYLKWIAYFNREHMNHIYCEEYKKSFASLIQSTVPEYNCIDFLSDHRQLFENRDYISSISLMDMMTYLPCDIMTKVDIASMKHSLEVRSPFLDVHVANLAIRMPIQYKIRGRKGKYILRETFREFLPPELENKPKTGFGVPLDHWFRGPLNHWLKDILTDPSQTNPILNKTFINQLIKEHEDQICDHSNRLWSLVVFQHWANKNGISL